MSGTRKKYTVKIPGRSIPEVYLRFENELSRQASGRGLDFNGRKLPAEAMLNAIVLHFLSLADEERDSILDTFVPRFDSMLGSGPDAEDPPFGESQRVDDPRHPRKARG